MPGDGCGFPASASATMPGVDTGMVARGGEGPPPGGLFIDGAAEHGASFLAAMPVSRAASVRLRRGRRAPISFFAPVSVKGGGNVWGSISVGLVTASGVGDDEKVSLLGGRKAKEDLVEPEGNAAVVVVDEERRRRAGAGAMNTAKHLWAGVLAAMVSRTVVAPLERLKLEYVVRGEKRNLLELIHVIATTQGLRSFWKGNFVNILRTAPSKAVNFYAYDAYTKQLLRWSGNEEITNFERFIAGAAAGVTATILGIPMDTIRTNMVAPGGEALGGVLGVARHLIQSEGFFSLYKGLVPCLIGMAPSSAVFYGVYDILKIAYLQSPEGKMRASNLKRQGQEASALNQLELGPGRTLLYGAIAGCCAEAATYPFEVVRRHLQMQVMATKIHAFATALKIVNEGRVPALYAGLLPSLLQVLPSASISYLVYELMKKVMKVE